MAVPVRVPHELPPLVVLVAPTSLIVYVVLTPRLVLAAASVGGELLSVTVGELAAVASALVATVKLKLEGAVASKPTDTVAPAATPELQLLVLRAICRPPVALGAGAVPTPLCRQEPDTRVMSVAVATTAPERESPIVTVPPEAIAAGATKVTV